MLKYAKAIVAGLSVGIATAIPLVGNGLSAQDVLIVLAAVLAGAFPTWVVKNSDERNEYGQLGLHPVLVALLCAVAVVVLLALVGHPVRIH